MKLYEKKDHLINKNPNLTQEQKLEIIELLGKHPSYENKIDWNKNKSLTYKDFMDVLRPLYINDLDFRGLVEGEDYEVLLDKGNEKLYAVYTYEASKILASNSVEPKIWTKIPSWCGSDEFADKSHAFGYFDEEHGKLKPGAKWCISMQTSDNYWNQYKNNFAFFFWFMDKGSVSNPNKKIAIGVNKWNWKIAVKYNGVDNEYNIGLPSYIIKALEGYKGEFKRKEKERLLRNFTLNLDTNRYDYDGDLDSKILSNFISDDKDGFTINFGEIKGDFDCNNLGLTSLKGAPQTVWRTFNCFINKLTSLKGAPQKVGGYFNCYRNQLTSLEGAPKEVGGNFDCSGNQLTSLEGSPEKVGGEFDCHYNKLTSLEGAPEKVGGNFRCSYTQLTSLKGAPKEVGGNFDCSYNDLTSLEGAPRKVGKDFDCHYNKLTSLEGALEEVGRDFYCGGNKLTSLKGAPKKVGRYFNCEQNQLTSLEGSPKEVGGGFICYQNQLTSLEGAPIKVGGYFNCSYNKLTSLEGAPKEVGENFYCDNNSLTSLEGAPQYVGGRFDCTGNFDLYSLEGIGEVEGDIFRDF